MKHLMTLLALVVAVTAGAQGTTIHEYPWNPDWDNDNFVGSSDLTGFLSAFGSEFGNPPEPCTYDGNSFEEFVFDLMDGSIFLDSLFLEYQLTDVGSYYVGGCPDPISDTIVYSYSIMIDTYSFWSSGFQAIAFDPISNAMQTFGVYFSTTDGTYAVEMKNLNLEYLGYLGDGFFGGTINGSRTDDYSLPMPSGWYMNEEGIHINDGWNDDDWPFYADYMHILPYWHYVE